MKIPILFIWVIFLHERFVASSNTGDLELIDYETWLQNDYHQLKNDLILLAVVNEKAKNDFDNRIDVLNELKKSIENFNANTNENQISLKGITSEKFIKKYGVLKFPQIFFFRKGNYVNYKGELTSKKVMDWVDRNIEKKTLILTDANFEHDTQASTGATTGDWFVLFHSTDCGTKLLIEPSWEAAALKLENQVNFAYVDLTKNPGLEKRFAIFNSPTVIFFKKGLMYRYDLGKYDSESLSSFTVKGFHKNVRSEKVPVELSWFDKVTDSIVKQLKEMDPKQTNMLIAIAVVFVFLLSFILYIVFRKKNSNKDIHSHTLNNIKID